MTTPEGRREAVNPLIQGCGNRILPRLPWLQRADQTGKAGDPLSQRPRRQDAERQQEGGGGLAVTQVPGCRAGGRRGARRDMKHSGTSQRLSGRDEDRMRSARDGEEPAGGFQPLREAGPRGEWGAFHWPDAAAGQLSHRRLGVCVQLREEPWTEITAEDEVTQERARMEKGRPSR